MANNYPTGWSNYNDYAAEAANEVGISASWFTQLLHNENGKGDPYAKNGQGSSATGLGQFISSTGLEFETPDGQPFDRTNPFQSIDAAAIYVSDLYKKFIGRGYSSDAAYAAAAKSYGDTADNNPKAALFQARLQGALDSGSASMSNTSAVSGAVGNLTSSFTAGFGELINDPSGFASIYNNILGTGASNWINHPAASAASIQSSFGSGSAAISVAASEQATQAAGLLKILATATSQQTIERAVLVILGLLLLAAGVFALTRSNGSTLSLADVPKLAALAA